MILFLLFFFLVWTPALSAPRNRDTRGLRLEGRMLRTSPGWGDVNLSLRCSRSLRCCEKMGVFARPQDRRNERSCGVGVRMNSVAESRNAKVKRLKLQRRGRETCAERLVATKRTIFHCKNVEHVEHLAKTPEFLRGA